MRLTIKGGRIIDPQKGLDIVGDIYIEDGMVKQIGEGIKEGEIYDAEGKMVLPAFVDLHAHLREPGGEYKEDLTTASQAGVAGGFCALFAMPNTSPPLDGKTQIGYIKYKASSLPLYVFPVGALSKGMEGKEMPPIGELAEEGVMALSDDGKPIQDSGLLRKVMLYAKMFNLVVMLHCEDLSLSRGGVMNEGFLATRMGLRGIPSSAEEVAVARAVILALETNCKTHIQHVSTKGSVELIRWGKKRGAPITCEATPHHLVLTEEMVEGYNTRAKCNPPLRGEEDREALIEGLLDGTIDCIATDHAPHAREEWDGEFESAPFGISGLETAFPLLYTHLVNKGTIPLNLLVEKMTWAPARIMGLDLGTIEVGKEANITVIDEVPRSVNVEEFFSKGKNNPLNGWILQGFPVLTISKGKITFRRC